MFSDKNLESKFIVNKVRYILKKIASHHVFRTLFSHNESIDVVQIGYNTQEKIFIVGGVFNINSKTNIVTNS